MTLAEFDENNNHSSGGGGDGHKDVVAGDDHQQKQQQQNGGICCNGKQQHIGNGHIPGKEEEEEDQTIITTMLSPDTTPMMVGNTNKQPDDEDGNGTNSGVDPHAYFLDRLTQTASMLFYLFTFLFAPGCIALAFIAMAMFPPFWPLLLAYLAWFIYDFNAPLRGSRSSDLVHNWSLWRNVANYFPIEVHKTADIPPDQNYVFASHPHGVFAISTFILLGSGGRNFREIFPGIKMHPVTLPINFWFPLRRELYLLFGNLISCQVEALQYALNTEQKGNAIGIVPGGAAEALHAFPGVNRLVLAKRKGFVRLAIQHGAQLVPVYNFGENDVFEQLETPIGSNTRQFQDLVKRLTGVSLPLCYGQNSVASVLPRDWVERLPRFLIIGFLPYRRKIVTVVGKPIPVPKEANPSRELVDTVHAEYCARLEELFNEYKTSLGGLPASAKLEFV